MNILIIGCRKAGSRLASILCRMNHDVSVLDKEEESFDRLDDDFCGITVAGVPIDLDVLRNAGIENCDAVICVTPNDNVNIMASQMAKEIFHVPVVICRIYDPSREEIFSHIGIHTVCPTNLTVSSICSALADTDIGEYMAFGTSTVRFTTHDLPAQMAGGTMKELQMEPEHQLFGVLNSKGLFHPAMERDYILREDDRLVVASMVH
ncbi:potassium channel family protein [Zongyangia hominis]|uniref:TrkA family potassium uptake protein n=1 Tax=Zongyangia hominis TaxID=2763677 RepID=A0A926EE15_9FIRM|nr:TrkA family potassium uptake protein [Zongyangia hominis]MBC8571358.1 TrkA family potassium uptake protein [Zongyangia hominis]